MKKKVKPQSSKLFGLFVRDGQKVELPVIELEPPAYPQHVYMAGWLGPHYVGCIIPIDRVTVYARSER